MTLKELFKKVEQINKNSKELGINNEEITVFIQFDYYTKETFTSFNKLCDYITEEYIEEYCDILLETNFTKEDKSNFIAQFMCVNTMHSILVTVE